jgi:hypothetical protein
MWRPWVSEENSSAEINEEHAENEGVEERHEINEEHICRYRRCRREK